MPRSSAAPCASARRPAGRLAREPPARTGNEHARSIRLKLDFLAAGSHVAHVYTDGRQPTELVIGDRVVRRGSELRLELAGSGGAAVRIPQQ
jgi:hypothetical protein